MRLSKFRYNFLQRLLKRIYRKINPVPRSPWTEGKVKNICEVNLVPPKRLQSFFEKCILALQKISNKKEIGNYLEFGVFNGSSLSSLYLASKKLGLKEMRLFGFDAFEGLPKESEKEDAGVWKKGYYSCSFEDMKTCLKRKRINPNEINWIKGWYDKTLNDKTIKRYKISNPGIIFIDCDTYSSSKKVLDFIKPIIKQETIICFDDWKLNDLDIKEMGEYRAFNEFLEANDHFEAREIKSYNRKSKAFIIQPRKK